MSNNIILQSRIIKNNSLLRKVIDYLDYKNHDKEYQIITIMTVSSLVLYVVNHFIELYR